MATENGQLLAELLKAGLRRDDHWATRFQTTRVFNDCHLIKLFQRGLHNAYESSWMVAWRQAPSAPEFEWFNPYRILSQDTFAHPCSSIAELNVLARVSPALLFSTPVSTPILPASMSLSHRAPRPTSTAAQRLHPRQRASCKAHSLLQKWERLTASSPSSPGRQVGVVLVDHGSRRAAANEALEEFAALFRRTTTHELSLIHI